MIRRVRLGDARSALAWHLVAAGHVDEVQGGWAELVGLRLDTPGALGVTAAFGVSAAASISYSVSLVTLEDQWL